MLICPMSSHQITRDTLINPVAANILLGTVECAVGISPYLVYGTGSYSQGHRTESAVDPHSLQRIIKLPSISKLWIYSEVVVLYSQFPSGIAG